MNYMEEVMKFNRTLKEISKTYERHTDILEKSLTLQVKLLTMQEEAMKKLREN